MNLLQQARQKSSLCQWRQPLSGWRGFWTGLQRLSFRPQKLVEELEAKVQAVEKDYDHWVHQTSGAAQRYFLTSEPTSMDTRTLSALGEVCRQTMGHYPFAEQWKAALLIHQGHAVQMLTGEGKTLATALAATLLSREGQPLHVITSNDYLAQRDAELMGILFEACSIRVGVITPSLSPEQRRQQYEREVVYCTSKELLGDHLRDRIQLKGRGAYDQLLLDRIGQAESPRTTVLRGLHIVIIDEADSVLSDDALTPLIIAEPCENALMKESTLAANAVIRNFEKEVHYTYHGPLQEFHFTQEGVELIATQEKHLPSLWREPSFRDSLLELAAVARDLYIKGHHYIVQDEQVIIIDDKTGRAKHGQSWGHGLHQAIEAKENLPITDPSQTKAKLSFQRFFQLFEKMGGLSGTLQGIESELWKVYRCHVVKIPPRLPLRRTVFPPKIFKSLEDKWLAVVEQTLEISTRGRPVLIGTRSIRDSEALFQQLRARGLQARVLNALHHEKEAEIISDAGQLHQVTIATNMAGRGTDIQCPEAVLKLGGLHVIATELHDSPRTDWQLYGRCSRQGEPGSIQVFLSCADELLVRHFPKTASFLKRHLHHAFIPCLAQGFYSTAQRVAQRRASNMRWKILGNDLKRNDHFNFSPHEDLSI